jgi:hypothetical protein
VAPASIRRHGATPQTFPFPGEPQKSDAAASLPATVEDEQQLEELWTRPWAADVALARALPDDVLVVGAGGRMGPSLARRIVA